MKQLPPELESVRQASHRTLGAIRPATEDTLAEENFLFTSTRLEASSKLPAYYLVYFLLVELLGFENLGQFEKIFRSIPIDFQGRGFLIEHRKFGIGVFGRDLKEDQEAALQIVISIQKAVKAARPFFDWLTNEAVDLKCERAQ